MEYGKEKELHSERRYEDKSEYAIGNQRRNYSVFLLGGWKVQ